jgi:hypothetical protein
MIERINGLVKVNVNRLEGPRINVGGYGRRCLSPASGHSARGQISECMIEDEDRMHGAWCIYAMQYYKLDNSQQYKPVNNGKHMQSTQ